MTKRMLIDATHKEETRVAVVDGTRLMEFDYESQVRRQLKGTIFLAKVTRVEPSLQAAFVNFGGNRHGFLSFAEVHPDYYRIPIADREALIAEQRADMEAREAEEREAEEAEERAAAGRGEDTHESDEEAEDSDDDEDVVEEIGGEKPPAEELEDEEESEELIIEIAVAEADDEETEEAEYDPEAASHVDLEEESDSIEDSSESESESSGIEAGYPDELPHTDSESGNEAGAQPGEETGSESEQGRGGRNFRGRGRGGNYRGRGGRSGGNYRGRGGRYSSASSQRVEVLGGDGLDGDRPVRPTSRRHYKIQEVIKRGQIMLIQVSKEERGNKGAAVTTYLSLPGRYCVLMPNSPRGGGVSRKIANFAERKRMREILAELNVPEGMSVIMRTAGMSRTKVEIKRDLDYLLRLWDEIRELTLKSSAPALIHEEGNLIRRAVRDLYSRDIEEIQVSGEEGFKAARDFMKVMMPSHAKRVVQYKDSQMPLFQRYQVENQIREMGEPTVTLRSGGYLVINPTEALVSVDVNSGRSTRERHIEETALKTNMEAAEEVARQLRLRDLGGLVVIDFIDMEDRRNNAKVERKLKESLSTDRARIQMGRISSFGLMELSRQRLNPSLTEAQFEKCKHCQGIGHVRTVDNAAILALRALEEEGSRARSAEVHLSVSNEVAIYILNNKREMLADIERRYEFRVLIRVDEDLAPVVYKVDVHRTAADDGEESGEGDVRLASKPDEHSGDRSASGERENNRGRGRGRSSRGRGRDESRQGPRATPPEADRPSFDEDVPAVEMQDSDEAFAEEGDVNGNTDAREPDGRERYNPGSGDRNGDRGSHRRGRRGGRGRQGSSQDGPPRERSNPPQYGGRGRRPYNNGPRDPGPASFAEGPQPDVSGSAFIPHEAPVAPAPTKAQAEPTFYGRRRSSGAATEKTSSETAPAAPEPAQSGPYEAANEPEGQKKKGWWNRLVE
jgi:ribonuclease E